MSTGERIKQLRIKLGMSQEELGQKIGVKKAAIHKYESGIVVNLKRSVIDKLALVLETTPAYLMELTNEDDKHPEVKKERPTLNERDAQEVYNKLVEIGFLKPGEELTERHIEVLADILSAQKDYIRYKLDSGN